MFDQLPKRIWDFAQKQRVGHLSVRSKYGVLVHPIAFAITKDHMVFGTPRTAKKLELLNDNSNISFTCDNGQLMKKAIGFTVLGRAETYGFDNLTKGLTQGIFSMTNFMTKYPELVKFYVRDFDQLPDANKFWKYVFVRVNPTSIVHWDGYEFGRITAKKKGKKGEETDTGDSTTPENDPVIYAKYVQDYYKIIGDTSEEFDESFALKDFAGDIFNEEVFMDELQEETIDATTLLTLPDKLRKTGIAILKFNEATAEQVAEETGNTPREAKNYLDRLTLMKMLNKKREGDHLIYYYR